MSFFCVSGLWFVRVTHRVFVRVHGERQLLKGPSYLFGRRFPADSQQFIVVLALCPNCHQKDGEEHRQHHKPDGPRVLGP